MHVMDCHLLRTKPVGKPMLKTILSGKMEMLIKCGYFCSCSSFYWKSFHCHAYSQVCRSVEWFTQKSSQAKTTVKVVIQCRMITAAAAWYVVGTGAYVGYYYQAFGCCIKTRCPEALLLGHKFNTMSGKCGKPLPFVNIYFLHWFADVLAQSKVTLWFDKNAWHVLQIYSYIITMI